MYTYRVINNERHFLWHVRKHVKGRARKNCLRFMKVILGHFNLCYHFNATYYSTLYMPFCLLESSLVLSSKFAVRSCSSKLSHFEVHSD